MGKKESQHSSITKPHVPSFSHHTEANSAVESDAALPSPQLLSNRSREQKIGNVCEGLRKRETKVRAKQINLPHLTIRCQYVAGAELAK